MRRGMGEASVDVFGRDRLSAGGTLVVTPAGSFDDIHVGFISRRRIGLEVGDALLGMKDSWLGPVEDPRHGSVHGVEATVEDVAPSVDFSDALIVGAKIVSGERIIFALVGHD